MGYTLASNANSQLRASQDQHRVAVAVEVVSALDGCAIRGKDSLSTCECRDQHEQRRSRQMKVGDEPLDDAKAMTGVNEERRASI
jgi:hypothetical protein